MSEAFSENDYSFMRQFFVSGATHSYSFRIAKLKALKKAIEKYEDALAEALFNDLHKSKEEAFMTEIGFLYAEISHTIKHLQNWILTQNVSTPSAIMPSSSKVLRVPLGVVLIIAPWNYPLQLLLCPLVGAIAGGNCAIIKPSEVTPHTSAVVSQLIRETFDSKFITVIEGDGAVIVPEIMKKHRFDHVFFTGSTAVGREIAKLAANKLVPVTLELGGKSPCIVDKDVELKTAAQRITWGKFTNAGQTCVAPDYLLVHEDRKDELIAGIKHSIDKFYGTDPKSSADYGRIVNERRFDKLTAYLGQGEVISGGEISKSDLYFSPTLMQNVSLDAPVMSEEIFGPILPVFSYKTSEEAIKIINRNANPLALYIFTKNKKVEQLYTSNVEFGGGCINNTLVHLGNPGLPFGGVGNSGVGAYHGKFSFDTFTRPKAILKSATWIDPSIKYPPYRGKLKWLRWFCR